MDSQKKTFEDEGTTEAAARDDYRKIAERRVRLGLVLAEIGDKNSIQVSDDEVTRAVVERARQFPGQEQQVWEYYRQNPQALSCAARAAVRGEGGRLPAGARQGHREAGDPRRALCRGRGRQGGVSRIEGATRIEGLALSDQCVIPDGREAAPGLCLTGGRSRLSTSLRP